MDDSRYDGCRHFLRISEGAIAGHRMPRDRIPQGETILLAQRAGRNVESEGIFGPAVHGKTRQQRVCFE